MLGMAFKSESDDKRESLSYKLRKLLMVEAREVLCTDPYVVDEKLVPLEEAVERADVIVLGAPHAAYRDLQLSEREGCGGCLGILAPSPARCNRRIFRIVKVLVTGASGFICGYLIQELLEHGYEVVGLDNFSKYGRLQKSYDTHPRYRLVEGDAKDVPLMKGLLSDCDHFVPQRPMIGGISYFHEFAYDLLAENERIIASSFDAAIWAHKERKLRRLLCSPPAWFLRAQPNTPLRKERRGGALRRVQRMAFKSSRLSTLFKGHSNSTSFPIPLFGPSTALVLEKNAHCLTTTS